MANEIISGKVQPVEPRNPKGKFKLFDTVTIELAQGGQKVLTKLCAAGEVADAIRRGGSGRFYLSRHAGQNGIHGIRLDDGTQAYAHYNNVETIMLIGALAGLFMLAIGLLGFDGFMITPVIIGAVLGVSYFVIRSGRLALRADFENEA